MAIPKLVFDIDGCLANFSTSCAKLLVEVSGIDLFPAGWKDDPNIHTPVWHWERYYGYAPEVVDKTWGIILSSPNFWSTLSPLPYARETLSHLTGLVKANKAEVYFITHRMGVNPKLQTEEWLYNHGFNYPTVLLSGNKAPLLHAIRADFFVDDKLDTMNSVVEYVGMTPDWNPTLYLKDAPYNKRPRAESLKVASSVKESLEKEGLWS